MTWFVSAYDLLCKGGYVMIPLVACSLISLAVMIERFLVLRRADSDVSETIRKTEEALYEGKIDRAIQILRSQDSPVTRVLAAGIQTEHLGERGAERAMEEQGTLEIRTLTRGLGYLDTIITIAPLLGLLGTVTGMISSFHVIAAKEGFSTPTAITGGVAEALIATAAGLIIAIYTLIGYNYLQERIKHIVAEIESRGTAMINVLADIGEAYCENKRLSA
ncbi:MAG: MotA/TolQ/ExbB proton channel family protein [Armatimonadetes bacterium]|nr:MotA/TolQ/ExbB proton channel family protein [Armatimonadota bacterium]